MFIKKTKTLAGLVTSALLTTSVVAGISDVSVQPSLANSLKLDPAYLLANEFSQRTGVMKFKLEDAGISVGSVIFWGGLGFVGSKGADWIRLEINGNQVRVIHTTRSKNWLTQIQTWWDHPVRNIIFKPNSCTGSSSESNSGNLESKLEEYRSLYDRNLISEDEYNQLRQNALQSDGSNTSASSSNTSSEQCLVYGDDDIVELPQGVSVFQGEFKVEYQESGEWKTVLFTAPSGTPITSE